MSQHFRTVRALITGAGEPAAVGFMHLADQRVEFVAADSQQGAAGFELVPPERRVVLPYGEDDDFVTAVRGACRHHRVDLVVPMSESDASALAGARSSFEAEGIEIVLSPARALAACLDTALLARLYAPPSIEGAAV